MLENLRFATYRFTIQAGEKGLQLPPWKASTFRGGFGHIFKKLACTQTDDTCEGCLATSYCAYAFVFETSPGEDDTFMSRYEQVPRPYLLEMPTDQQTFFEPGDLFTFRLRLFGRAIEYAPLFVTTFQELGKSGIGKGRNPYRLIHVEAEGYGAIPSRTVYTYGSRQVHRPVVVTGADLVKVTSDLDSVNRLTIFFETPLRMKSQGTYTNDPQFSVIFRNILRRTTGLLQFHHDMTPQIEAKEWIGRAEQIRLVRKETKWVDHSRYSQRQESRMKLGGFIGWAQYEGEDLAAFLPWLKIAEVIHLGKNTVFDLGRIRVGYL
jgi:hypothetical protein